MEKTKQKSKGSIITNKTTVNALKNTKTQINSKNNTKSSLGPNPNQSQVSSKNLNKKSSLQGQTKYGGGKRKESENSVFNEELKLEEHVPEKINVKEMIEQASVEQRAITMIDDTLDLFNNKEGAKICSVEKYELIDKVEYETMKNNNKLFKERKNLLKEEYSKLKEEYEKIIVELNMHNYKYYNTEKAKTDSITKLYSMESELKKMIISNNKLQNEINQEINGKNNIFKALNEFKRKYNVDIHPELKEIFDNIKSEQYNPISTIPTDNKVGFLEEKLEALKKELQEKEDKIDSLKNKIREIGS